ncbi:MAG TPA: Fe-S cluster assembly protein SufD [Caulobacteraceae bacterium]|nr:Fe-S cluster assembly protein SufD [Caulobacteraceae bacterium]
MSLLKAIEAGDASLLPSRRDEAWRYSDLRAALRAIPDASPSAATPTTTAPLAAVKADHEILVLNGRPSQAAFRAKAGAPQVLRLRIFAHADHTLHQGAVAIDLDAGADLTLIETYEGQGADYVSDIALAITVGAGARMERIVLVDEPADAISISGSQIDLEPGARLYQSVVTAGARLQRHETQVRHPGGGADVRLDGLYLLSGKRHADLTTVLTHAAPDGTTRQLTKGVVRDAARGVFQGRILVEEGADRTDARMGHHALLLNDGAEVDAKPELEIYADEVSCAHGNTVGSLDDQALFYMRARGLPEHEAKALLMQAFVGEVGERIEHPGAREAVAAWVAAKLESLA